MVQAAVIQMVLKCNDFKTKLEECRDPATSASLHVVEATAANRSGGRDTATPGGRVPACRAATGRAFDELQRCIRCAHFVRGLRAVSW